MNVLIMDDDKGFAEKIKNDFVAYFEDNKDEINIYCLTDSFENYKVEALDVAFLDIDLKECTGFHIAKQLYQEFSNLLLVFVSSHNDLVYPALQFGKIQFIRKSNYLEDHIFVFRYLKKQIQKQLKKKMIVVNGRYIVLLMRDIEYLLSIGREVIIHTKSKEYIIKSSIKDILKYFNSQMLVQIQRTLVINLEDIEQIIRNEVIMKNGKRFVIGRVYNKNFNKRYFNYIINEL